jgi:fatty acid synthase subunit alpha
MQQFYHLLYPSRSIQTDGLKVGFLKSFGFGQVGGECIVIHPDVLLATLDEATLQGYTSRNNARRAPAYRRFNDMFVSNKLVILKDAPPVCSVVPGIRTATNARQYTPELEAKVLLNPLARATAQAKGSYAFTPKSMPEFVPVDADHLAAAKSLLAQAEGTLGVGTDIELVSNVPVDNATFLERNFTEAEIRYCKSAPDARASFAGRWAGAHRLPCRAKTLTSS